jgi:nucleotide-binding universal stress UspA family protein
MVPPFYSGLELILNIYISVSQEYFVYEMRVNINNNNKNEDTNRVSDHDNNKISKILAPIVSRRAADYALYLSSKLGTELCIIHVLDNIPYEDKVGTYELWSDEIMSDEIKQIVQEERGITKEWFDEIKARANKKNIQVIKTELVITRSSIESAIINYAERNRVDLIVVGPAGHSGFKKLLFGSVALGVINHSHCPVMLIK